MEVISMTYAMKAFDTPEGRLELEFDFIPKAPTDEQLGGFVEHTCETCIYDELDCLERKPGGSCECWRIGVREEAELAYYKALQKKHYG